MYRLPVSLLSVSSFFAQYMRSLKAGPLGHISSSCHSCILTCSLHHQRICKIKVKGPDFEILCDHTRTFHPTYSNITADRLTGLLPSLPRVGAESAVGPASPA
ncbi:uncharacterized protein BDZ83DRAFT_128249 [Colletotrichum acutatum]|uniref:Uncharacterized protein n=1 Tax=Glomerella acutata TaxID=27357 RepID=A0AAD8XHP7_GLOAC|nr:uncharacterized protein BDZ83DRAFT_128249 [Colletotrichum acutatum]KAK1728444.1 hypothetical protein BDZ83DRAFT_128249 [Colletotrichum acutatum]